MSKILRSVFNEVASEEAKKNGRLDYRGLRKLVGNCILCNSIPEVDENIFVNVECGELYPLDEEEMERDYKEYLEDCKELEEEPESYENWQLFIADENDYRRGVEIYQYYLVNDTYWLEKADELVLYSEKLDCYVWCIKHYGTSWDYVLTSLEVTDNYDEILND